MTFRTRFWFGVAGLVLLVLAAYWPVRSNGFIWDDDNYIEQNINLRTHSGLGRIWRNDQFTLQFYPLTLTSFWAEYHLWGTRAEALHLDNVLLEALSAVLLWQLLTMLNVPGAWAVAAIWAVHPINVESVAWASERKNVLSGVFYLAAGLMYLRGCTGNSEFRFGVNLKYYGESGSSAYLRPGVLVQSEPVLKFKDQDAEPIRDQEFEIQNGKKYAPHGTAKYLLALCFFILAMLSKTTAASFPAAVLLVTWWKRGRISRAEIVKMLPFFGLAAAGGFVTSWVERTAIGATGATFQISFGQHLLIAGRALWFYLAKLFWPHPLVFIYPRWSMPMPGWMWIYPASALGVIALLFALRRKIGRGPVTASLFFVGTLFPALGFINVYPMNFSFIADHFQYLAGIAPIAAVVGLVAGHLRNGWQLASARLAAGAAICACAALTWKQIPIYHDIVSLWSDVVSHNPESPLAQFNDGDALRRQGGALAAVGRLQEAKNRWTLADKHLLIATKLSPHDAGPWIQLGLIDELREEYPAAEKEYRQALLADPTSPTAEIDLGRLRQRDGDLKGALAHYQQAVQDAPYNEFAIDNLGLLLARMGNVQESMAVFERATRISSYVVDAHWYLGQLLARQGKLDEALEQWKAALAIYPDNAKVLESMGISLAAAGRLAGAQQAFEHALRNDPESKSLQRELTMLHQMMNAGGAR